MLLTTRIVLILAAIASAVGSQAPAKPGNSRLLSAEEFLALSADDQGKFMMQLITDPQRMAEFTQALESYTRSVMKGSMKGPSKAPTNVDEMSKARELASQGKFDEALTAVNNLFGPVAELVRADISYQRFVRSYDDFVARYERQPCLSELKNEDLTTCVAHLLQARQPHWSWKEGWRGAIADKWSVSPVMLRFPEDDSELWAMPKDWFSNVEELANAGRLWLALRHLEALPALRSTTVDAHIRRATLTNRLWRLSQVRMDRERFAADLEAVALRKEDASPQLRADAMLEVGLTRLAGYRDVLYSGSSKDAATNKSAGKNWLEGAERAFRRAIQFDQNGTNGYAGLGAALMYKGDVRDAKEMLLHQCERHPESGNLWLYAALAASVSDDSAGAASAMTSAEKVSSNAPRLWSAFAVHLEEFDRTQEALVAWQRAAELGKDDAMLWSQLAVRLRSAGKLPQAIAALRKAVIAGRNDATTLVLLGDTLAEAGEAVAARESFLAAINLAPNQLSPWRSLRLLLERGSGEEQKESDVARQIANVMGSSPSWPALCEMAAACVAKDIKRAAQYLSQAYDARVALVSKSGQRRLDSLSAPEVDRCVYEIAGTLGDRWKDLARELSIVAPARTAVMEQRSAEEARRQAEAESLVFRRALRWTEAARGGRRSLSTSSATSLANEAAMDAVLDYRYQMAERGFHW